MAKGGAERGSRLELLQGTLDLMVLQTLITSRGGLAKPKDLEVHRDFMRDFLESARQAKNAGRTAAEAAKAWRVPPRYVGYTAGKWVSGSMEWIYRQLP